MVAGRPLTTSGVDIVLALDASGSMKAEDFQPRNRLEVAKEAAARFVQGRPNDRIGLVTFAGQAVTRAPLTLDQESLVQSIQRVEIGELAEGTAIGTALATAVHRLRASDARSRVVILLTDGVNNAGEVDPLTAAEAARALGARVYTIGVGTTGEAPYLLDDRTGRNVPTARLRANVWPAGIVWGTVLDQANWLIANLNGKGFLNGSLLRLLVRSEALEIATDYGRLVKPPRERPMA